MDEVCTTAFDGECEVYKRFGLDRVVVLRYVDGKGAPNSVEVNLSRFTTADGAYAMFTKRVVADGDPARATVKPAAAGAAGATSSSNAYVWRGPYLVELTFVTEDTKMTPAQMAQNEQATGAIAKDIGGKLPGPTDLLPAAAALPAAQRSPSASPTTRRTRSASPASARSPSATTRTATSDGATSPSCAPTPTPRRRRSAPSSSSRARCR